jgi:hypothetical protein
VRLILVRSVYAATLRPGRLASWLEGAAKLGGESGTAPLLQLASALVGPARPTFPHEPPNNAAAKVSEQQWEEGSKQLRQQVQSVDVRELLEQGHTRLRCCGAC